MASPPDTPIRLDAAFAGVKRVPPPVNEPPPVPLPPKLLPKALPLPLFSHHALSDGILERIRRDFPGWDVYALQAEFDAWLSARPGRKPKDYDAAFYGFVRRRDAQQLG